MLSLNWEKFDWKVVSKTFKMESLDSIIIIIIIIIINKRIMKNG